jgi:hypothetical protein
MRVRMLVGLAGGIFLSPGDEAEFADAEAIRLIDAGFAVPAEKKIERATKRVAEKRKK